jgi:hypothetical protein
LQAVAQRGVAQRGVERVGQGPGVARIDQQRGVAQRFRQ